MSPRQVLVIGATRILRPAAITLAAAGHVVHVLARSAADLDELVAADPERLLPMCVDYCDAAAFTDAMSGWSFDHAVVYAPEMPPPSWATLNRHVIGMSVRLLTSAAARPAVSPDEPFDVSRLDPAPPSWCRLLLGWTGTPPRWHEPEEISAAAVDTLCAGDDRILGTVRPWSNRPTG